MTILERLQRAWERKFIDGPTLRHELAMHGWSEDAIETIDASMNFALAYLPPARLSSEAKAPTAPTAAPLPPCAHEWREMRSSTDPYRDDECRFCGIAKAEAAYEETHHTEEHTVAPPAAALAQLPPREPTAEMVGAGFQHFRGAGWAQIDAINIWRAMYDAAPTGIQRPEPVLDEILALTHQEVERRGGDAGEWAKLSDAFRAGVKWARGATNA